MNEEDRLRRQANEIVSDYERDLAMWAEVGDVFNKPDLAERIAQALDDERERIAADLLDMTQSAKRHAERYQQMVEKLIRVKTALKEAQRITARLEDLNR
jgi:chaperonin cofactor prefoldin